MTLPDSGALPMPWQLQLPHHSLAHRKEVQPVMQHCSHLLHFTKRQQQRNTSNCFANLRSSSKHRCMLTVTTDGCRMGLLHFQAADLFTSTISKVCLNDGEELQQECKAPTIFSTPGSQQHQLAYYLKAPIRVSGRRFGEAQDDCHLCLQGTTINCD